MKVIYKILEKTTINIYNLKLNYIYFYFITVVLRKIIQFLKKLYNFF
jgi:hypothetical protein